MAKETGPKNSVSPANHYVSLDGEISILSVHNQNKIIELSEKSSSSIGTLGRVSSPGISPLDRGFLYGDGLMETILVIRNTPVLLDRHLERLRWGADQLGIPVPWKNEALAFEINALVQMQSYDPGYIRLVVTAGCGAGLERVPWDQMRPTKIFYFGPVVPRDPYVYQKGVAIKRKVSSWLERRERIKLCHYLPEIVALGQARKEGFEDILWSREDGELIEASSANLFLIARQGDSVEILTPPGHSGILMGITRQKIIELLGAAKIPVTEQIVYSDELPRFDEAFLTSSLSGLVPIRAIDRHQLYTSRDGSTFRHIERLYRTWLSTV